MTTAPVLARRSRFAVWAVVAALALAAWLALARWMPAGASGWQGSLCLFYRHTHVPCPGCGLTRAFAQMGQGNLATALRLHPLAPLLAAEGLLLWLAWGWSILSRRVLPLARWEIPLALAHLALFSALWLFRLATGTLPP